MKKILFMVGIFAVSIIGFIAVPKAKAWDCFTGSHYEVCVSGTDFCAMRALFVGGGQEIEVDPENLIATTAGSDWVPC